MTAVAKEQTNEPCIKGNFASLLGYQSLEACFVRRMPTNEQLKSIVDGERFWLLSYDISRCRVTQR